MISWKWSYLHSSAGTSTARAWSASSRPPRRRVLSRSSSPGIIATASSATVLEQLQKQADMFGQTIRLVRFLAMEEVLTIVPRGSSDAPPR